MSGPARRRTVQIIAVVAAAVVMAGCTVGEQDPRADGPAASSGTDVSRDAAWEATFAHLPRADVRLGGTSDDDAVLTVTAVVADTPASRTRGLQGVTEVPSGAGMLFVLPGRADVAQDRTGFWMLDTLVALDIAFAADGVVVGVATMLPCPAAPCPITHPGVPYDAALEVAAGVLAQAGIGPGDRFAWHGPGATTDAPGDRR